MSPEGTEPPARGPPVHGAPQSVFVIIRHPATKLRASLPGVERCSSRAGFAPAVCTTAGALEQRLTPTNADAAFLVVPNDGGTEGYYGDDSDGIARPPSGSPCFPQSLGDPVCQ